MHAHLTYYQAGNGTVRRSVTVDGYASPMIKAKDDRMLLGHKGAVHQRCACLLAGK